jgi:translation elongation factor EF-G
LQTKEINTRDPRATLQIILRRYIPLSDAILRMVVRVIPDPIHAQKQRISTLLPSSMLLMMNNDNNIKYNCKSSSNITKIIDNTNCNKNIFRIDDHQKNDEMRTTASNTSTTTTNTIINSSCVTINSTNDKDYDVNSDEKDHHVNSDEKDHDDHHSHIIHSCQQVKYSLETCDISSTAPVVVFISKMIPFRLAELASRDIALLNSNQVSSSLLSSSETTGTSNVISEHEILTPNSEVFVALGRVFSGILTRNTELFVVGNKYDPFTNTISTTLVNKHQSNYDDNNTNDNSYHHHQKHDLDKNSSNTLPEGIQKIPENSIGLYLMLGPSILSIDEVYAGNIVGIIGLNQYILKTATLSSIYHVYPIKAMTFQTKPMLKVAIETKSHLNLKKIEYGIQQLYQYDPVVEIGCDESTGQLTITCLGELHLEQCLKALIERFAKCDINVSEPLIAFRETIISSSSSSSTTTSSLSTTTSSSLSSSLPPPWCDMVDNHAHNGRLRFVHTSEQIAFTFRCFPLKSKIINFLNKKSSSILEKLDQFLSECHRKFDLDIYNHYDVGQTNSSKNQQSKSANIIIIPSYIKLFCMEFLSMLIDCDNNDDNNDDNKNNNYNNDGNGEDDDNLLDIVLSELRDHAILLKQQQQQQQQQRQQHDADNSSSKINSNDDNNNNDDDDAMIELVINHILAIGSRMCCNNLMLLNEYSTIEISCSNNILSNNHLYSSISKNNIEKEQIINLNYKNHQKLFHNIYSRLHSTINASFQAAMYAGPLMHEPMYGIGFYIEKMELTKFYLESLLNNNEKQHIYNHINIIYNNNDILKNDSSSSSSNGSNDHQLSNINTGQLISELKLALHSCILSISSSSLRIMEPIYQCSLQCDQNQLNNLYSVILSRRGIIYEEDIIEGTTLFLLKAYIPIYNSFGFTQQLLKKTSGKGITPQLHLSHYQKLNKNPFWKPTTNDEIEIYGDNQNNSIEKINLSRSIIDQVRKRKGLIIEEKVVMYAEKQRTLNKKK